MLAEEEEIVLQFTAEITLISKDGVSNDTYDKVTNAFGENVLAKLIPQIIINSWNSIAVSTRQVFG